MPLRFLSAIIGLFFFVQGINWILAPASAAERLGMPLLEGVGRSTQIGDVGGFFISLGVMIGLGGYLSNGQWLRGGALMLGTVAIIRSLAVILHDAPFTAVFISVEVFCATLLVWIAARFDASTGPST